MLFWLQYPECFAESSGNAGCFWICSVIRLLALSSQWSGVSAPSSGVCLPAGTGCRGDCLWAHLPSVAVATEAALPPPAADLCVLLCGRLLLLPAPVRQPAEAGREAQTAVRCRPVPERSQVRSPTHLHPSCTGALEQDTDCSQTGSKTLL